MHNLMVFRILIYDLTKQPRNLLWIKSGGYNLRPDFILLYRKILFFGRVAQSASSL
jgi:hypothetical protein